MAALESVPVGPFMVADATREGLTGALVDAWVGNDRPMRVFALHVGGLNRRRDRGFVSLLQEAEWVYADGAAVVLIARAAGAREMQRTPTTDLAHAVLAELARRTGREVRVALLGGPPGLAERAAECLEAAHSVRCVMTSDGYRDSWGPTVGQLRAQRPDVVFVGMGMPREAQWVTEHLPSLPAGLVMTCGGWFGFLAGEESRAPAMVQRYGLEWLWRLVQAPRLLPRYALGIGTTVSLMVTALGSRVSRRRGTP